MTEKMTLARPYAKAAFQHALTSNKLNDWSIMLANAAEMIKNADVKKIISNPTLTKEKRATFFTKQDSLFDDKFCNFIRLTANYDRLDLLPEIYSCYVQLKLSHDTEMNVQVTSAVDLDDNQKKSVTESLNRKLGTKLNIKFNVDASIIGGLVVRTGDVVIDGSVKGQLKKLTTNLMN
jgi:F-type H+-transporting ATPase subunit delta